ncbi:hypothetical protein VITU102760_15040 [Vibrio tubiashii]|uniref:GIY-YIG domain-containing protein n=1 Tax=Vibrio tubiashii ATCC 19109 TaxID=1051646 RepID=F9T4E3_9VIBR|nr:hypothetical protein [Vibrio tubiashii]AIW13331.1 hypothetical protein IX91_03805 [Vibrio tubiashii ATCC 19109]EGU56054.1 hypothetical protein VITU9109_08837 [Vibrio tubiashii ATCC 19109]EIF04467.1 hypothetical protein VT1337_08351 [Vibrio tubiashii NCIMB 1337 = ATCC 19106]
MIIAEKVDMPDNWSDWLPLNGGLNVYHKIPVKHAGVYRIRARKLEKLIYIGQTGRCLRQRLRALSKGVYSDTMPWNDPHTAAPNLWVWMQEEHFDYEFSFILTSLDTQQRQGLEDYFLWRHRCETGSSTLCNYGRFHRLWMKPSNRKQAMAGGKLSDGKLNPSGLSSSSPLKPSGGSSDDNWMGLLWSQIKPLDNQCIGLVPQHPIIYRIQDTNTLEVIYIGETKKGRDRLKSHARKEWGRRSVCFSYVDAINLTESFLRHEIEVDLIGAFFEEHGRVPEFQYKKIARQL